MSGGYAITLINKGFKLTGKISLKKSTNPKKHINIPLIKRLKMLQNNLEL